MSIFTFEAIFKTTRKGIPNISQLPASTSLSRQYFICSVILQSIFLLIFIIEFGLSLFRVIKKIKDNRFQDLPKDEEQLERSQKAKKYELANEGISPEHKQGEKQVYQFDEEDEEDKGKKKETANQIQKSVNDQQEKEFETYHDQNEQSFLVLDKRILHLQPFLVSFIICNNAFAANVFTPILACLTLATYTLLNIKRQFKKIKTLQYLFICFSILGFTSFFHNDHDLST